MADDRAEFQAVMARAGASADLTEGIHEVSLTHSCVYTTGTRRQRWIWMGGEGVEAEVAHRWLGSTGAGRVRPTFRPLLYR